MERAEDVGGELESPEAEDGGRICGIEWMGCGAAVGGEGGREGDCVVGAGVEVSGDCAFGKSGCSAKGGSVEEVV